MALNLFNRDFEEGFLQDSFTFFISPPAAKNLRCQCVQGTTSKADKGWIEYQLLGLDVTPEATVST
jgi:hypothetical protein